MEEEKKLYPLVLIPVADESGGSFSIADLGSPDSIIRDGYLSTDTISEVMDVYMDRVVGEQAFSFYGRQFPVLVRHISKDVAVPVTVHPDDTTAAQRFDFLGKDKLWYVVCADPGATVNVGFRRDVSSAEFYFACKEGRARKLMNSFPVAAGDVFRIAPGTVHAASPGVEILEVAESSPLDFTLESRPSSEGEDPFDASLTLEAAFDFIDYRRYIPEGRPQEGENGLRRLLTAPPFTVSEIRLADPLRITASDSFTVYHCISGSAAVKVGGDADGTYAFAAGSAVLLPAEIESFDLLPLSPSTVLLEINL